jgi:hypothetical protein
MLHICTAALIHATVATASVAPAIAQNRPGAPAKPGEDKQAKEAKDAFKAGKKAFESGKFAEALEQFKKADALVPGAAPRFMLGQTYEKLGKPAEAVAAYQSFIDLKPDPTSTYGKKIPEAQARITALSGALPATVEVKVIPHDAPGLTIFVDNKPVSGQTGTISLAAGTHVILVNGQGFQPHTESITLKGNERRNVVVTLQPTAASQQVIPVEPPPETKTKIRGNAPAFVFFGLAGAGAIVGGVFGGLALSEKSKFNENPTHEGADRTERNALIADISFGAAAACAITGTILLFVIKSPPKSGSVPQLAPWAGPHAAGAAAGWRF